MLLFEVSPGELHGGNAVVRTGREEILQLNTNKKTASLTVFLNCGFSGSRWANAEAETRGVPRHAGSTVIFFPPPPPSEDSSFQLRRGIGNQKKKEEEDRNPAPAF